MQRFSTFNVPDELLRPGEGRQEACNRLNADAAAASLGTPETAKLHAAQQKLRDAEQEIARSEEKQRALVSEWEELCLALPPWEESLWALRQSLQRANAAAAQAVELLARWRGQAAVASDPLSVARNLAGIRAAVPILEAAIAETEKRRAAAHDAVKEFGTKHKISRDLWPTPEPLVA